jgi:hypothetical protein
LSDSKYASVFSGRSRRVSDHGVNSLQINELIS